MIILGDCYQEILKVDSDSIDLIIIDPPYLIQILQSHQKILLMS